MIWRENSINNGTNEDGSNSCRNSIQGKTLIVDDEGYVCSRNNLLNNGCCDSNENVVQYNCDTCDNQEGCCSVYESCVSCCLNPDKVRKLTPILPPMIDLNLFLMISFFPIQKPILEKVMEMATGRQTALFATVRDQFELCIAKCRTDSHSVQHENKYTNPDKKFCYAYIEAHESQRDN